MLYIGIDTGTHTGIAVWDAATRKFLDIDCVLLHQALLKVKSMWEMRKDIRVRFEDARKRKWFDTRTARQDRARLQGAGSVKRDCNIWEEFLTDYKIPYDAVPPCHNATKLSAEAFRRITKWEKRTNEHSRDAAMLVYGKTVLNCLFDVVLTNNKTKQKRKK